MGGSQERAAALGDLLKDFGLDPEDGRDLSKGRSWGRQHQMGFVAK